MEENDRQALEWHFRMTVSPENIKTNGSGGAFVEAHYYDGGLRHAAAFEGAERPSWAPKADWVGFRDEFKLRLDELAVEIVKFRGKTGTVSWLGVYAPASDSKYGDRNNHAGVGLWLRDQFPHDTEWLVDGLVSLLSKLRSTSLDEFRKASLKFLGLVPDAIGDFVQLSKPLSGLLPATSQAFGTVGFNIPNSASLPNTLNGLSYRAFFFNLGETDASRMLIHVHEPEASSVYGKVAPEDFSGDLVKLLPIAHAQQSKDIERAEATIAALEKEKDRLDSRVDVLEVERENLKAQFETAVMEHSEFRKAIEEDDELKRFSQLNEGLNILRRGLEGVQASLSGLENRISQELRNAENSRATHFNQYQEPQSNGRTVRNYRSEKTEWDWTKIFGLMVLLALLIGLVGYFIWQWIVR